MNAKNFQLFSQDEVKHLTSIVDDYLPVPEEWNQLSEKKQILLVEFLLEKLVKKLYYDIIESDGQDIDWYDLIFENFDSPEFEQHIADSNFIDRLEQEYDYRHLAYSEF